MSTHTPGPWTVSQAPGGYYRTRRSISANVYSRLGVSDGRDSVAEVYAPTEEMADANARLIAAAPDLLAALKTARGRLHDLLDYGVEGEPIAKFCDAAIAKAEEAP